MKELHAPERVQSRRDLLSRRGSTNDVLNLYQVDSPQATTYCVDEERAREKVVAYAMLDELAFVKIIEVPSCLVSEEVDGTVEVFDFYETPKTLEEQAA